MAAKKNRTIDWQEIKKDARVWYWPVGVGAVILVLTLAVVVPLIKGIKLDMDEVEAAEKQLKELVVKRTALEAMDESVITSQLESVNTLLPSKKQVLPVIGVLGGSATESGMVINQYEFALGKLASASANTDKKEMAAKPGELESVKVEAQAEGGYVQIMSFLRLLERVKPLTYVELAAVNGEVSPDPGLQALEPVSLDLEAQTVYALPIVDLGKVSEPLPELSAKAKAILLSLNTFRDYNQGEEMPVTEENRGNLFAF